MSPSYRFRLASTVALLASLLPACGDDSEGTGGASGTTTVSDASSATTSSASTSGSSGSAGGGAGGGPREVSVEGDVLAFLTEVSGPRIVGATVTILEHPEMTVVVGDDAHFRFDGLHEGEDVTLVVEHEDIKTTQTATITLGPGGIDPFAVQVLPTSLFTALSTLVPLPVEEEDHCVIASTVTRFGGSLYVHMRQGVPGVEVALTPAPADESGPIYFNEQVLPDVDQPATSTDGGVFFYRVEPGDYEMSASRDGYVFSTVRFQCRAGLVVNAGPTLGLQAHDVDPDHAGGRDLADDEYTAVTDELCAVTATCVNDEGEAGDYPEAMEASCRAMFRNTWASVDEACDAEAGLRDAASVVYACRVEGPCDVTLGHDEACAEEEVVFREAEAVYGACVAE